jgi:UDP-N-acetylmuramoyl-tripeptide--D-alanyl-D-alanine ligase
MISNLAGALALAIALPGGMRWLRIAQREHYLPGSVSRFAVRWWVTRPQNAVPALALAAGVATAWAGLWPGALVAAAASLAAPLGLSYRGRTSRLAWTRRLRTLTAVSVALIAVTAVAGALGGVLPGAAATLAAVLPAVADLALLTVMPLERRLGRRYVRSAARRLESVRPRVVAITGSYGKTSTKFYAGHLVSEKYVTLTSPASFNNVAGLSRTVNERLAAGTEVFVAEMGTYGRGEIRALCDWVRPEISVITAIGPVHLERMGSLDNIARAKSEILERAQVGVLNVDNPRLAVIAADYQRGGGRLVRCSAADPGADVYVAPDGSTVSLAGRPVGSVDAFGIFPTNLACAIGVAVALEIPESEIAARLGTLPKPEHRQAIAAAESGIKIIDDTYNSNPAGSAGALATLASLGAGKRRVVVTPGMVELGREQSAANEEFARQAASVATDILVVGRTNRRALLRGAADGPARVRLHPTRQDAVTWVRRHLDPGDVVLYENDLPDHYP